MHLKRHGSLALITKLSITRYTVHDEPLFLFSLEQRYKCHIFLFYICVSSLYYVIYYLIPLRVVSSVSSVSLKDFVSRENILCGQLYDTFKGLNPL